LPTRLISHRTKSTATALKRFGAFSIVGIRASTGISARPEKSARSISLAFPSNSATIRRGVMKAVCARLHQAMVISGVLKNPATDETQIEHGLKAKWKR
jgi:hypothetical protein